jgi:enterochelin esterase-like enzyme
MKRLAALFLCFSAAAHADSTLTPDILISSDVLGYDLQYRVYLPDDIESLEGLPVLYVTDGPGYIKQGKMPRVLNRLIKQQRIDPVIVVFVDSRDPDNLKTNRRNDQFACNRKYLEFYTNELLPSIESAYPAASDRSKRTILGVSFGGLNAACFGLMGSSTFSGIGMNSPANHPVPALLPAYEDAPLLPLRIFLSTGNRYDNEKSNREFRTILRDKGYPLKYMEVPERHNWENWEPLVDDVLLYFYAPATDESSSG